MSRIGVVSPDYTIHGEAVENLSGWLVYEWVGEDGASIYVGKGGTVGRPFSRHHDKMNPRIGQSVHMWFFDTEAEALNFETEKIRTRKPKLNGRGFTSFGIQSPTMREKLKQAEVECRRLRRHLDRAEKDSKKYYKIAKESFWELYEIEQLVTPYLEKAGSDAAEIISRQLRR